MNLVFRTKACLRRFNLIKDNSNTALLSVFRTWFCIQDTLSSFGLVGKIYFLALGLKTKRVTISYIVHNVCMQVPARSLSLKAAARPSAFHDSR